MSAAFLVESRGTPKRMSAEFSREVEEDGLKFSVENAAEDIVNTLFCTYEPPTSKKMQYKAAKAFRKHPERYKNRPHVPKSILKFKVATPKILRKKHQKLEPEPAQDEGRDDIDGAVLSTTTDGGKKSVRWRDQQKPYEDREDRTDIENTVAGLASKYCGGAFNHGDDIADILSSPQGRAAQTFFGGPETPGSVANMTSSLFGGTPAAANTNANSSSTGSVHTDTKIFYDDSGNPIREDDVPEDEEQGSYFPSTPKDAAASVATENPASPQTATRPGGNEGQPNLFCSNIPFMDTVITGIGIAGVMAASAAVKAGVPENYCNRVYTTKSQRSASQEQISEELRQAQETLGVYEPESYDKEPDLSSGSGLKRQSTPRNVRRKGTPRHMDPEDELREDVEDNETVEDQSQGGNNNSNPYSSRRSYVNSDITMGNTTVKHFGNGNASLFDDMEEDGAKSPSISGRSGRSQFASMVEELKHVQKERRLGSSVKSHDLKKQTTKEIDHLGVCVSSIKNDYQKSCKSPKHSVVTSSYLNSINKSPVGSQFNGAGLPATPNQNRQLSDPDLFEKRTGSVASLAKQFESPRSNRLPITGRKSVDPSESRFFDGKVDLLPPTPRRKSPETPTGYSMVGNKLKVHDWDTPSPHFNNKGTPSPRFSSNRYTVKDMMSPKSGTTYNTEAEVREAPSSILDNVATQDRPNFGGQRPASLVTGPETVDDDTVEEKKVSKKKNKKGKSKEQPGRSKSFTEKLKKSVEKAQIRVKNATRKVEASRIPDKEQGTL